MDFTDILHTRQSCRNFDPARAPDEGALRELLEAGRLAPSACNSQPYHFHVARGASAARVAALTQGFGMNKFTGQCPCFIVIAQRPYNRSAAVGAKFKRQDYRLVDIGLAAGNIVSRACELGLGTCMLGCESCWARTRASIWSSPWAMRPPATPCGRKSGSLWKNWPPG